MGAQWKQKWRELAADQKGKIVGKITREILVACKLGGANPEFNARLAAAIAMAKRQSVTKDTIERALAKGSGTGADAIQYHTVQYEGFTPHRVPVIVECLTDNNNRTSTEIKMLFKAGNLGTPAPVAWTFDNCGLVEAQLTGNVEGTGGFVSPTSPRAVVDKPRRVHRVHSHEGQYSLSQGSGFG